MMQVAAEVFLPENERFKNILGQHMEVRDTDDFGTLEDQDSEEKFNKYQAVFVIIARAHTIKGCKNLIERAQIKVLKML
jgi:hypothetical protein